MYALVLIVSNLHISLPSLKDPITRLNLLTYRLFITFTAISDELQAQIYCILCNTFKLYAFHILLTNMP